MDWSIKTELNEVHFFPVTTKVPNTNGRYNDVESQSCIPALMQAKW